MCLQKRFPRRKDKSVMSCLTMLLTEGTLGNGKHIHTHTHTHTHTHSHSHTHMHASTHTRTRPHAQTHTHTHSHTHSCMHAVHQNPPPLHYLLASHTTLYIPLFPPP